MRYVDVCGERVSALGMGMMRLPVVDGDAGHIDQEATNAAVDAALAAGINYFDTAWGYHKGTSEVAAGVALGRHERGSYFLASKFPSYDSANFGKHEQIFAKQLQKCQVQRFDFYLLHNVNEANIDFYLSDEGQRTIEYLLGRKAAGQIGHLGFSTHSTLDTFTRFLQRHGQHMEFCQLEVNYLDWEFQDAKSKVALCGQLGLPVWVMEPLRGGYLCKLSKQQLAPLAALRPQASAHEWAFRWLAEKLPNSVILSGMGSAQMVQDNARIFSEGAPLAAEELAAVDALAAQMAATIGLPCTACRYCTEYCPQGLDIPELLALYNEARSRGDEVGFIAPMRIAALAPEQRPSACIGCGACKRVCPQGLAIPEALAELAQIAEKG